MSSRSISFDNSGALLTASSVAVYTVPAGYKATVQKLLCYNTDAAVIPLSTSAVEYCPA